MIINSHLTKKSYRKIILRYLFFESRYSLIMLVLYLMLFRTLYYITKIGQLRTNLPIFFGICILLFITLGYLINTYRKYMKKDFLFMTDYQIKITETELTILDANLNEMHVLSLNHLIYVKENKKWLFLYFKKDFIPILKEECHSIETLKGYIKQKKSIQPMIWYWTPIVISIITVVGAYSVYSNAVHFNGALAWKLSEWKTDTKIKMKNNNFYSLKLDGLIEDIKKSVPLEPYLQTNDLTVEFTKNGTITSINTYIYGFDEDKKLKTGYLIYYDQSKSKKISVHKQEWNGDGTVVYDPENDLSIVMNMIHQIDIENEIKPWNERTYALLYKGIRNWGNNLNGIRYINRNGKISMPSSITTEVIGPTISLYIPNKENIITPKRFVYLP